MQTLFSILLFLLPSLSIAGLTAGKVFERALSLEGDRQQGQTAYLGRCSQCHGEQAWGSYSGEYPQLAGQHATVIIKQLADIHSGKRIVPAMTEVVAGLTDAGAQVIADIATHLSTRLMNPYPEWGEADDPSAAEPLYREKCAQCHGVRGEGDAKQFYPLLQGQHYEYLLRELRWLRDGSRGNAHPRMADLLADIDDQSLVLLADYLSRMMPPPERLAED